jgi:hypothetical protein
MTSSPTLIGSAPVGYDVGEMDQAERRIGL